MRSALGDGYAEALRSTWDDVPESADFVMFWWHHAAQLLREERLSRFGFITTNSLRQTFNRRVVQTALEGRLHLAFAVPDHPWVDSADGAAVRIAMTVAAPGAGEGRLLTVTDEGAPEGDAVHVDFAERQGRIHADLSIGADVAGAVALRASSGISSPGVKLHGAGFIVTPDEAAALGNPPVIHDYRNGRDLTDKPRGVKVVDLFGLGAEQVRSRYPAVYQWVLERVKPERDHNNRATYRDNWWLFGEPRKDLRPMLAGLRHYIATVVTTKHRTFQLLGASIVPDDAIIAIASDDAWVLGVLSSRVHVVWALAAGGTLEDRPRYNKTTCFDAFAFPAASPAQQARIRELAEALDAHRKDVLARHPALTLTGLYNVLEKLRAGQVLNAKEKTIHDDGLVAVLKSLHDDLDAAVLDAYGWSDRPSDETLLERLVALNTERAAEEARGHIRWLRPAFQDTAQTRVDAPARPLPVEAHYKVVNEQVSRGGSQDAASGVVPVVAAIARAAWPATLPEQVAAVARVLADSPVALTQDDIAARFTGKGPWKRRLPEILETLAALGRARPVEDGRWLG